MRCAVAAFGCVVLLAGCRAATGEERAPVAQPRAPAPSVAAAAAPVKPARVPDDPQAPSAVLPDGTRVFGHALSDARPLALATIAGQAQTYDGQVVKTEGKVEHVCEAQGCWLELTAEAGGPTLHATLSGHSFFVPSDIVGHHAVVEGRITTRPRSAEEIEHLRGEGAQAAALALGIVATGVEVR